MIAPQYRPLVGGYERAAERLAAGLAARGHRVWVVTEQRDPTWPRREVEDGVVVRRLPCAYRPGLHRLTALASLAGFLATQGHAFDVWHVHQHGDSAALARLLGWLLRRPVVLKVTSTGELGLAATLARGRLAGVMAALHRRLDAVVALTRESRDEAEQVGVPPERIHLIANALDLAAFRPVSPVEREAVRQDLGLGEGPCVAFVGRLVGDKNVPALLTAWREALKSLAAGWRLVLVGDGPLRATLAAAAADMVAAGRVVMAGHRHDVEAWLTASDVYVTTSDREGLSNTMLEAMACGLPVVATRVSGVTEFVAETGAGLAVAVGDAEAIARALVTLCGDAAQREALGRRARHAVETRCSVDAVAQAHEALYRQLRAPGRQP
jgi:glycosyltransferase involved in cell wall biosynthesis